MRQALTVIKHVDECFGQSSLDVHCAAGQFQVMWDHALNHAENHEAAALEIFKELGWHKDMALVGGQDHLGNYVFVQVEKEHCDHKCCSSRDDKMYCMDCGEEVN